MTTIAVIIDNMFEDGEYIDPARVFHENGHILVTVGVTAGATVVGKKNGTQVTIDRSIEEVRISNYDVLLISGGYSPDKLRVYDAAVAFVRDFPKSGKPVFAICHAIQLVVTTNVLNGRRMTGYESIAHDKNALVFAIPMGGIPVALRVREALSCSFDSVIVRKFQIPGNPEAGFGALTREGDIFLNEALMAQLDLTPDQIERQTALVQNELENRNRILRGDRSFPDLNGRTVVLIDDGLASGYTMKASVFMAAKRKAGRIVIAVPTAPRENLQEFKDSVDEFFCPNLSENKHFAIADAYKNWEDTSPPQVFAMLKTAGILTKPF